MLSKLWKSTPATFRSFDARPSWKRALSLVATVAADAIGSSGGPLGDGDGMVGGEGGRDSGGGANGCSTSDGGGFGEGGGEGFERTNNLVAMKGASRGTAVGGGRRPGCIIVGVVGKICAAMNGGLGWVSAMLTLLRECEDGTISSSVAKVQQRSRAGSHPARQRQSGRRLCAAELREFSSSPM